MSFEWIVIETLAVIVENLAIVHFMSSRFESKRNSFSSQLLVWFALCVLGLVFVFAQIQTRAFDIVGCVAMFVYLHWAKRGVLWQKVLCIVITYALVACSSFIGAGISSMLIGVNMGHTLLFQDTSRLLALVFIKAMQVVLFFTLAKKPANSQVLKKNSLVMLSLTIVSVLSCIMLIFTKVHEFDSRLNSSLTWLAAGLLTVLVVIFLLYEMFMREETRNIDLSTQLQRLELEMRYFSEIDAVYADIRTWRHEYRNNLIALRTLVEHGEDGKALEFIDGISLDPMSDNDLLQTGNLVLDAVVSSKLWFANSHGIKVDIQAVYPKKNYIEDNDICAIAGNLLDNAIEACLRMGSENQDRFISFTLLVKGKNLALSICNSFEGAPNKDGDSYLTVKDKHFHGIGIKYVDSIVEKYGGHVVRSHAGGIFETHVMLPLIPQQKES